MIQFEQNKAKQWSLTYNNEEPILIELIPSSITNKFSLVTEFVLRVSTFCGDEFDLWFTSLLKTCEDPVVRPKVISDNIPVLKRFINDYITSKNLDYGIFVNTSKVKANSILFVADEIERIIRLSSYLKIYSFIFNNKNLKLGQKVHKELYNQIASDVSDSEVIYKIFNIVKTKTFKYSMSDKFMWDYIKTIQCKDIGVHVIEIFNFIMNNILVLCEEDKNPITYFVGVIDESVKWFLRSVYKGSIVYDDSISTEDIQGKNVDNLKTYSYNDTLGRLKQIAYDKIYEILEKENVPSMKSETQANDLYIIDFHNRMTTAEFISPLCEFLVYPILSRVTKIPYSHFKTISPEHSAVLSIYTKELLSEVFRGKYKTLFSYLEYYPLNPPSITTTYKIKNYEYYLELKNEITTFFGFSTKIVPHTVLCNFIGRFSRIQLCNILDGKKLSGIALSKLEIDMIHFFTYYFADQFEKEIKDMEALMNKDF
jgi:hypothetical protein